jgi:hypothetical protein
MVLQIQCCKYIFYNTVPLVSRTKRIYNTVEFVSGSVKRDQISVKRNLMHFFFEVLKAMGHASDYSVSLALLTKGRTKLTLLFQVLKAMGMHQTPRSSVPCQTGHILVSFDTD